MQLSDFDYHLPEELIAQTPVEPRDSSRLLVIDRKTGKLTHSHYYDLADFLQPGDVLVRNNTKVIPARLYVQKETGGTVEILLNKKMGDSRTDTTWEVLTRPGLKVGQVVNAHDQLFTGECIGMGDDQYTRIMRFNLSYPLFLEALAQIGQKLHCLRISRPKIPNSGRLGTRLCTPSTPGLPPPPPPVST